MSSVVSVIRSVPNIGYIQALTDSNSAKKISLKFQLLLNT